MDHPGFEEELNHYSKESARDVYQSAKDNLPELSRIKLNWSIGCKLTNSLDASVTAKGGSFELSSKDCLPAFEFSIQLLRKADDKLSQSRHGESNSLFLLSLAKRTVGNSAYSFWEMQHPDEGETSLFGRNFYPGKRYAITLATKDQRFIGSAHLVNEVLKEFRSMKANPPVTQEGNNQVSRGYAASSHLDFVYLNNFRIFFTGSATGFFEKTDAFMIGAQISFTLCEISVPFKFIATPLSLFLSNKSEDSQKAFDPKEGPRFGYLTLDSQRRIYPLLSNDEQKHKYPLIGVWVWGLKVAEELLEEDPNTRRLLWGVLTEFMTSAGISSRYPLKQEQASFLLVSYNLGQPPKYLQFRSIANVDYQMVCYDNVFGGIDLKGNSSQNSSDTAILDFLSLKKKTRVDNVCDMFGKQQVNIQVPNSSQSKMNGLHPSQYRDQQDSYRPTYENQNGSIPVRRPQNPLSPQTIGGLTGDRSMGGTFQTNLGNKPSVEDRIERMEGMLHMLYDAFVQLNTTLQSQSHQHSRVASYKPSQRSVGTNTAQTILDDSELQFQQGNWEREIGPQGSPANPQIVSAYPDRGSNSQNLSGLQRSDGAGSKSSNNRGKDEPYQHSNEMSRIEKKNGLIDPQYQHPSFNFGDEIFSVKSGSQHNQRPPEDRELREPQSYSSANMARNAFAQEFQNAFEIGKQLPPKVEGAFNRNSSYGQDVLVSPQLDGYDEASKKFSWRGSEGVSGQMKGYGATHRAPHEGSSGPFYLPAKQRLSSSGVQQESTTKRPGMPPELTLNHKSVSLQEQRPNKQEGRQIIGSSAYSITELYAPIVSEAVDRSQKGPSMPPMSLRDPNAKVGYGVGYANGPLEPRIDMHRHKNGLNDSENELSPQWDDITPGTKKEFMSSGGRYNPTQMMESPYSHHLGGTGSDPNLQIHRNPQSSSRTHPDDSIERLQYQAATHGQDSLTQDNFSERMRNFSKLPGQYEEYQMPSNRSSGQPVLAAKPKFKEDEFGESRILQNFKQNILESEHGQGAQKSTIEVVRAVKRPGEETGHLEDSDGMDEFEKKYAAADSKYSVNQYED